MINGTNQIQYSGETDAQYWERVKRNDEKLREFHLSLWQSKLPMACMRRWAEVRGFTHPLPKNDT